MHAPANATDVPYQVQRQAEIDAARAQLPPSLNNAHRMPTYEGPTLEAMQFTQPPLLPADNAVDKRGYPLNEATFMCMFNTALVNRVWVYMFRIFCLWVYGHAIPEDQQLLMHKLAIERFFMTDWFAEALSALSAFKINISVLDGESFAGWLQYNEMHLPGCDFIDDAWSVDKRKACGANLFDLVCIHRDNKNKAVRVAVKKIIIEIMVSPGLYEQTVITNMWELSDARNIQHFLEEEASMLTLMSAMKIRFTEMGIDVELINDANPFAHSFLRGIIDERLPVTGWTNEAAVNILLDAQKYGLNEPAGIEEEDGRTVVLPHPIHPWQLSGERALQDGSFAHWTHPLLQGMRREANSSIQAIINSGVHPRAPPKLEDNFLVTHNPWIKHEPRAKKPAIVKARVSPTRMPQFTALATAGTTRTHARRTNANASLASTSALPIAGPVYAPGTNTPITPSQFPPLTSDVLASYNIGTLAGPYVASTTAEVTAPAFMPATHTSAALPIAPSLAEVVVRIPSTSVAPSLNYGDANVPMGV
ncbi:hypothetical protein C8R44DRAFT_869869 [Mycena epipterygia]|nr:hypothetical protein C8R44DRAFT_869869 [Mycena epipterygia]